MKEFKTLKIIGVDHGYGNIKTAGTVTKNSVTILKHFMPSCAVYLQFADQH